MNNLVLLLALSLPTAEPVFAWKQTDESLALIQGERIVWQLNYKTEEGKACFHPVTIAGSQVLTDFRPADHPWHRAIWFSWKSINGLIYWEEDPNTGKAPGVTEIVSAKLEPRSDHSARIELSIGYHPPGRPTVLSERRVLEVSAPSNEGGYAIDWLGVFTAGDADVVLDRTPIEGEPGGVSWGGYAGLSLRLAPELRRWQFADSTGPAKGTSTQARWVSFSGLANDGRSAAIVVLDHPQSFRHPAPWYLIQNMPYFSPAVLYRSPYTLPAGQSLTLKYRILLQPQPADREAIEAAWRSFSIGGTREQDPLSDNETSEEPRP